MNLRGQIGNVENFSGVIILATLFIYLLVIYFFGNGALYATTPVNTNGLIYLFALPPVFGIMSSAAVYFKARRDRSVVTFYLYCLVINLIATGAYCWLWSRYAGGDFNREGYSYIALGIIHFLLLPVGLTTYLIMWTPHKEVRHEHSELREADIVNWNVLHDKLQTGLKAQGPNPYQTMMAHMHWAMWGKISKAETSADLISVSEKLVAELNDIITDPDFYDEKDFHGGDGESQSIELGHEINKLLGRKRRPLTDRESQRLNRLLLEACFRKKAKDGTNNVTDAIAPSRLNRWHRHALSMQWESFLADLKDGCGKSPFWAVVFFFTVFLAITYLFGFAFAFHDKHRTNPPQQEAGAATPMPPALYRVKSLPSGEEQAEATPTPSPAPSQGPVAAPTPYTFYFGPYSAVLNYKYRPFDESASYADGREKSGAWRARKNFDHFSQLVNDIEGATRDGKTVRVRVLASTDAEPVKQVNYASNYELSEARARNVEYIITSRLTDKARRGVEWFYLPQSTELPRPPLGEQEGQDSEVSPASGKEHAGLASTPQESQMRSKLSRLNGLRHNLDTDIDLSTYWRYLDARCTRLENLIGGGSLSSQDSDELLNKLQIVMNKAGELRKQPDGQLPKPSKQKREIGDLPESQSLEDALNKAEVYASYVDASSRRRVVEVSLEPVEADAQSSPLTLKDYADSQHYSPLTLMDYMYFTIYTITTTGYGDIVPTTPYAKFLCSLANILEVFFFVVFFNALLSVRGGQGGRGRRRV